MAENYKRALTSTNSTTYYGKDANESKAMSVTYIESTFKIGIHRLLPEDKQKVNAKYDYSNGNTINLTAKKAHSLARLLKKAVKARNSQEPFSPIAITSAQNMIEVAQGSHYGCDDIEICLCIYNNIDADSRKPETSSVFQFRNDILIGNYNSETGDYERLPIDADIYSFIENLEEFSKSSTNAYVHFHKKELRYDMDRYTKGMIEIQKALGIQIPSVNSSKNIWNQPDSNNGHVASASSTSDLLAEIGGLS